MSQAAVEIETTVTQGSTFNRSLAGFGGPDHPTDLDRLAASLDYLRSCCCETGADEAKQYPGV